MVVYPAALIPTNGAFGRVGCCFGKFRRLQIRFALLVVIVIIVVIAVTAITVVSAIGVIIRTVIVVIAIVVL